MRRMTLLVLFSFYWPLMAQQTETYVIAAPQGHYMLPLGGQIMQQLYRPLGITPVLLEVPAARSPAYVNAGNADAEMARLAGLEQDYPGLVPLAEPLLRLYLVALATDAPLSLQHLQQAKAGRVVIRHGARYVENYTASWKPVLVQNVALQLNLLLSGRVDYALVESLLPTLNLPDSLAAQLQQVQLLSVPMYHYVYQRHQAQLPQLNEQLQRMRQTGEIAELIRQFELQQTEILQQVVDGEPR